MTCEVQVGIVNVEFCHESQIFHVTFLTHVASIYSLIGVTKHNSGNL